MMKRTFNIIFLSVLLITLAGCVEKYDFNVENETEGIVIEAFISDKSYNATRTYPSDGRYFEVRLAKTSRVDNVRDEVISNATVELLTSDGNSWFYSESFDSPGTYILNRSFFAAQPDLKYQLRIKLENEMVFESSLEEMPTERTEFGEFSTKENSVDKYKYYKVDGRRLITEYGLDLYVNPGKNESGKKLFYRWAFEPLWIFRAPNARNDAFNKQCWVRTPYYTPQYVLAENVAGDYNQKLIFIQAKDNHRLADHFSVLTIQTVLSEGYYNFWKDLQAQSKKGGLFDQPPFGLATNFSSTNSDWTVNGYFGVVAEDAARWTFDSRDVSYVVENIIHEICTNPPLGLPLGPECRDCRAYQFGEATLNVPWWW